tara:strand:+ start:9173 stop:9301 length:129 start_codon:yes stop_codon:yes gene_type:complete
MYDLRNFKKIFFEFYKLKNGMVDQLTMDSKHNIHTDQVIVPE